MESGWSCTGTWPAEPASVARARDFVTAQLLARQLAGRVDEARLVASELATNAVLHARTPFTVTVGGHGSDVTVRVRDGSSRVPVPGTAVAMAASGRGLFLVGELSQNWGVTVEIDGGKSVWAQLGP